MRVKTVFVFAVCSFLFVVALESKKATDEVKNKKTKGGKDRNEECKAKMTMKAEKHREARTYSGIDSIPEGNVSKNIRESEQHSNDAESTANTNRHHYQRKINIKPKSLKVLNAYEQCKMECKRQRDNIQTQEHPPLSDFSTFEQLRAELAAAEQALAAESAEQSSATESVNLVTASISTTEVPYGAKENLVFPDNL